MISVSSSSMTDRCRFIGAMESRNEDAEKTENAIEETRCGVCAKSGAKLD